MSVQGTGVGIETTAGRATVAATTTEENAAVLEASEDREVHLVSLAVTGPNNIAELSFSNSMLTDAADANDETASGILALARSTSPAVLNYSSQPPIWDAGEELNVHLDNAGASTEFAVFVIGYVPIGEFRRSRLRNS